MTKSDHPTYPNPTIQEAICEIIFRPQGGTWNPLSFGQFFDQVKAEFPFIEAAPLPTFSIQIGGTLNRHVSSPPSPQILRYRHQSRPLLLQLSDLI